MAETILIYFIFLKYLKRKNNTINFTSVNIGSIFSLDILINRGDRKIPHFCLSYTI